MLDCARTRGPCSGKAAPDPLPCPRPPRKKLPWIYLAYLAAVLSFFGLIYKYYVYRENQKTTDDKPPWSPRRRTKRPLSEKDMPPCVQYLIIGTGAAGWSAYKSIMENDPKAKVLFVTREDIIPYARPPMSKQMWFNPKPPDLKTLNYVDRKKIKTMFYTECKHFKDPVDFYRMKTGPAVALASGWSIIRVDADEHIAWVNGTCGERPIYYERCLIAVGSKPINLHMFKTGPKGVRKKVCTLRTIRDLEMAYPKVREAKNVVIIGGGLLGTELAWHISRMHKEWFPPPDEDYEPVQVVHVIKDGGILGSIIPEYLGVWAMEKLKCENVTVMPKTQVYDAYEAEDDRLKLTLSNGNTIVTDFVFVCVGTTPREELAAPSYLELDPEHGGFKVNTELEARKHLYVAGDAASVFSQWKDHRLRFDHYLNAEEQGRVAGANMCGKWTPWNGEPHYWLKLGDVLEMEVVGEVGACMPTVALFKPCEENEESIKYDMKRGEYGKPCYKQSSEYKTRFMRGMIFYLRDEIVVGITFWNFPPIEDRKDVATEILRAKPHYQDINILAELLGYPEARCDYIPPEERVEVGPCLTRPRKW